MSHYLNGAIVFQVVKLDSGDYGNFGTGTHVDVTQPFLLYAARCCSKVNFLLTTGTFLRNGKKKI